MKSNRVSRRLGSDKVAESTLTRVALLAYEFNNGQSMIIKTEIPY